MERKTLKQFIRENAIRMTAEWTDRNPNMTDEEWSRHASHYKCIIRKNGKQMTTYFSMGSGLTGEPTAEDVLNCLALDSGGVEQSAGNFEDWCSEYGYDTDSRKAEKTFKACEKQADQLKRLLGGEAYENLLWNTESL